MSPADRCEAMRVLLAVLEEGSLAGAARRLGRSRAAVSRAIALLERRTGATLLHRTARRLHVTEAGARYAAACRGILAELDAAERAASAAGDPSAARDDPSRR